MNQRQRSDIVILAGLIFAYVLLLPFMILLNALYIGKDIYVPILGSYVPGLVLFIGYMSFYIVVIVAGAIQLGRVYAMFRKKIFSTISDGVNL